VRFQHVSPCPFAPLPPIGHDDNSEADIRGFCGTCGIEGDPLALEAWVPIRAIQ
jgi:hypothetical protein